VFYLNPVAFSVFGYDIKWYGIMIALGMTLGIIAAKYTCKLRNVNYDTFINMILIAIPSGIIGARLYYVVFEFQYYKNHILSIFNIREGGLAIHGGIIFGVLAAAIYAYNKKLNFFQVYHPFPFFLLFYHSQKTNARSYLTYFHNKSARDLTHSAFILY
jgi:phosphatidylglycerol:prolipoprotein diacylglycerol transferase